MALRFSARCLNPNRSLCMATQNSETDGPFRSLRFKLHSIRHDFQNVLIHADTNKLVSTAEELLTKKCEKKNAFWEVYSKRVKKARMLLSPTDAAFILRSFDVYDKDAGIYSEVSSSLLGKSNLVDAFTMKVLVDIFSRRLKRNLNQPLFHEFVYQLPNVLYQMSAIDILSILMSMEKNGFINPDVCAIVEQKVVACLNELDAKDLGSMIAVFANFGHKNPSFYGVIEEYAVTLSSSFDRISAFNLLSGFLTAKISHDKLMGCSIFADILQT